MFFKWNKPDNTIKSYHIYKMNYQDLTLVMLFSFLSNK